MWAMSEPMIAAQIYSSIMHTKSCIQMNRLPETVIQNFNTTMLNEFFFQKPRPELN